MKISHAYIFENNDVVANKIEVEKFIKDIYNQDDLENNPDLFFIKCIDKSIKINQIRDIQKDILIKPIKFEKKIYVIESAESMTTEAQNALLKILEEPPQYAVIILETTMYFSLLDTIRSRSVRIKTLSHIKTSDFDNIDKDNVNSILNTIGRTDKVELLKTEKFFDENKEYIYIILEFMMIQIRDSIIGTYGNKKLLIFGGESSSIANERLRVDNYYKYIDIIENTYRNLKQNGNFQMCIDEMLLSLSEI